MKTLFHNTARTTPEVPFPVPYRLKLLSPLPPGASQSEIDQRAIDDKARTDMAHGMHMEQMKAFHKLTTRLENSMVSFFEIILGHTFQKLFVTRNQKGKNVSGLEMKAKVSVLIEMRNLGKLLYDYYDYTNGQFFQVEGQ